MPNLTESVSVAPDGTIHLTMTNLSIEESYDIETTIVDRNITSVKGEIITEEMHAKNTFDDPDHVTVKSYNGAQITEKGLLFTIPACSVLYLELR